MASRLNIFNRSYGGYMKRSKAVISLFLVFLIAFSPKSYSSKDETVTDVKFSQVFPSFSEESIHRLSKRYFETDPDIKGLMVAVQYGLKDQGEPSQSGIDIFIAIETIFSRLEDTDVIGQLQSVTKRPLLKNSAGEATYIFDEGTFNRPMITLSTLSDAFRQGDETVKGAISLALGGRDHYSEGWAMLNRYEMAIEVSINSIFTLNN